jgi:hypothetical protein
MIRSAGGTLHRASWNAALDYVTILFDPARVRADW